MQEHYVIVEPGLVDKLHALRVKISRHVAYIIMIILLWGFVALNTPDSVAYKTADTFGFTEVTIHRNSILLPIAHGCGIADKKVWYVSGVNPKGVHKYFIVCGGEAGSIIVK